MVSGNTERFRVCHFIHEFLLIGDREYHCADVIICLIQHHRTWVMGANISFIEEHTLLSKASPHIWVICPVGLEDRSIHQKDKASSPTPSQQHAACAMAGTRKRMQKGLTLRVRHFLTLPLLNCGMWESLLNLFLHFFTSKVQRVHLLLRVDIGFRRAIFF